MTIPTTFSFGDFKLEGGDGGTPTEVFATICGFTDRALKITSTAEETTVPDCDSEDAPAWPVRDISVISASITGQGVTTTKNAPYFRNWTLLGAKKNLRIGPMNRLLADDGGYYSGAFVLTSYEEASTKGKRVTVNVQIDSSGPVIWVPATA